MDSTIFVKREIMRTYKLSAGNFKIVENLKTMSFTTLNKFEEMV